MSITIGVYTLFRAQGNKKNYFLLMQTMIVVYLFGYFIELTSTNIEEAFAGAKIMYMGAAFVSTFVFFFLCDYCELKLHPLFVRGPLLIISLAAALILWVTKLDYLIYAEFSFNESLAHHLSFTPGNLYYLLHLYPIICMAFSLAALLYRLKKWKEKYREQLLILIVCLLLPFITEVVYFITVIAGINADHIYLTPYAMALMNVCLFMGVVRFSIFEIFSMTTISAMDFIRDGFVVVDNKNNFLLSNPTAVELLPGIAKLVKGESIFSLRDWPVELGDMENGSLDFSSDKGANHFKASISPVFGQNNTLIAKIVLFNDVTENVALMKKLEDAAYIDALTGLYNRKHFFELAKGNIEKAERHNQTIYTAMLDLDFFKQINDTYGHVAGDMALAKAASVIRHAIRSYDLLGRYGGEEFIMLVTELENTEVSKMMERVRKNMENTVIRYENVEIRFTCSIGLSQFAPGDTLESSIKKADEALYAAKHSGRNHVCIYRVT